MIPREPGRENLEAAVSLAMLPVGVALGVVSALAAAGLLLLALIYSVLAVIFHPPAAWMLVVAWFWAAGVVMCWCAVTAVEATGGLDWRSAARIAAVWGLVVLAYPGTWL